MEGTIKIRECSIRFHVAIGQGPCVLPRTGNTCATVSYLRFSRFAGHACEACYRLAQPGLGAKESSLTPRWRKRCIQLSLRNAFKQIVTKIRLVNDAPIRLPRITRRLQTCFADRTPRRLSRRSFECVRMKFECVWSLSSNPTCYFSI